ncbi:MAG TPA: Gfo/Idh/MocA family oxidoreductase, partial [Chthonomonadaceae bacterium]|nr:Gfo/Idh/MocA family oxidoreductase [Chthonomonadaceae bacterium]
MAEVVRFAIVGSGMGYDRARKAASTPGAQLVAICTLDPERGRRAAEELGCELMDDYAALLAREDIDVVGILTPSGWHCDFAIQALKAGKHVFTTKPMDIRLEKCDAAIRAAQEAGKVFAVDFESRYAPINHQIRQAVRSGALGRVFSAELRMKWYRTQGYYDGGTPAGWRSRLETEGGSAANQAVHYLDLLQWWLGPVQSLQGRMGTFTHKIETEDNTQALLTFASGAWGLVQTSISNFP